MVGGWCEQFYLRWSLQNLHLHFAFKYCRQKPSIFAPWHSYVSHVPLLLLKKKKRKTSWVNSEFSQEKSFSTGRKTTSLNCLFLIAERSRPSEMMCFAQRYGATLMQSQEVSSTPVCCISTRPPFFLGKWSVWAPQLLQHVWCWEVFGSNSGLAKICQLLRYPEAVKMQQTAISGLTSLPQWAVFCLGSET